MKGWPGLNEPWAPKYRLDRVSWGWIQTHTHIYIYSVTHAVSSNGYNGHLDIGCKWLVILVINSCKHWAQCVSLYRCSIGRAKQGRWRTEWVTEWVREERIVHWNFYYAVVAPILVWLDTGTGDYPMQPGMSLSLSLSLSLSGSTKR